MPPADREVIALLRSALEAQTAALVGELRSVKTSVDRFLFLQGLALVLLGAVAGVRSFFSLPGEVEAGASPSTPTATPAPTPTLGATP